MSISIIIENDIIRSYRRLAYTPWHALAEFVDNSTQSYFNNRETLDAEYCRDERLEVRIVYDRHAGFLRIGDSAMGMSFDELTNALKIGNPPANTSGRSQFGLGMKTAACWLGDVWTIKTTKLGETTEHSVTIDVEKVARGNGDLDHRTTEKPEGTHYTIVEISNLHLQLQGRRLGKIKDFLRSMYRVDIREGLLDLYWQDTRLEWQDETNFLVARDGTQYKKDFRFEVGGKPVYGWVGILGEGSRSRANAGFSMLRRGRVVKRHPEQWRPEAIFGWEGRNDLINQRLAGEIHFDDFEISHTKDDIQWIGSQEDDVQAKLKEICQDYISRSRGFRVKDPDTRGPSAADVSAAVDSLAHEINSPEFVDRIELGDVPPPEIIKEIERPILEAAEREDPDFEGWVGNTSCKIYLSTDESPNDPYFVKDIPGSHIVVIVNTRHPHWSQLEGASGVLNYLRHCVYDAIAECIASRKDAAINPETIKTIKDGLLRLPAEIEQTADSPHHKDEK
jgi:hypothetical protein